MFVVKMLLVVTCPACSALILAPLYFGPLPDLLCLAFATAQPLAAVAFYRLIRRAVAQEVLRRLRNDLNLPPVDAHHSQSSDLVSLGRKAAHR